MKITLLGAAGEVTGSSYLVETAKARVLVDFGMFQGSRDTEQQNVLPLEISKGLDAVLLTHAHLDHCGRLPLLAKAGITAPIYATAATKDLTALILRDSARLQSADAKKGRSRADLFQEPLYDDWHVTETLKCFKDVSFEEITHLTPEINFKMRDSGHILGSASIELRVREGARERVIVFSGDIGPKGVPFHCDPKVFTSADLVFLESTYGDRNHKSLEKTLAEANEILISASQRKSKLFMPVFAVGRAQQILYYVSSAFRENIVPPFPIYLDSPMAIEASKLYFNHSALFDEQAAELLKSGKLVKSLKSLVPCPEVSDSKELNSKSGPCLIMAGSGMCTGGRIVHHLRHNLGNPNASVVIVGFQSEGSLGRKLVDRSPTVFIFGEEIPVRVSIHTLGGFSAHAGRDELLEWIGSAAASKPIVALTHGEDLPRRALAMEIERRFGIKSLMPKFRDVISL